MQIIKLQKNKKIAFPEICPVCEQPGQLERFPVGSLMDYQQGRKMHIPVHKTCWRKSNNMAFTFTAFFCLLFAVVLFFESSDGYYISGGLLGLIIYFGLKKVFPPEIEVERHEEYIQLLVLNDGYADKLRALNEEIQYNG